MLTLYSLYTQVLLILNLIDVWYFQNVCSFKKGPNVRNQFLKFLPPDKKSPSKFSHSPPTGKPPLWHGHGWNCWEKNLHLASGLMNLVIMVSIMVAATPKVWISLGRISSSALLNLDTPWDLNLNLGNPLTPSPWVYYWLTLMNRAIGSTKMSHMWHNIIDVKWISFKHTGKETDKLLF